MNLRYIYCLAVFLIIFSACSKTVKPAPVTSTAPEVKNQTIDPSAKDPAPEEESKIKLHINFDGKWRKASSGSKAIIIIAGKTGRIIGKNGGEIPINIKYLNEMTVKIFEYEYNCKYLENWLPNAIAEKIYLNDFLKKTYSVLRIIDEDTLEGTSYTWQVCHNKGEIQSIEPLVVSEEWKRIKDE